MQATASTPTALRAKVSRGALAANVRRAIARIDGEAIADLSRDAFGHGLPAVAIALAAEGVRSARAEEDARPFLAATGIAVMDVEPTLDSRLLYGLPGADGIPAMRVSGTVLSTKALREGEGVSYNYTHRAARDTRVALITGGFGQGILRGLGNHVEVEIRGRLVPIVGRVAMDVCVVDIDDSPVGPGDEVVYFGGTGPARDALAQWERVSGLTAAELVCTIGLRVDREDTE